MPELTDEIKPDISITEARQALRDMFPDAGIYFSRNCHEYGNGRSWEWYSCQIWSEFPQTDKDVALYQTTEGKSYADCVNLIRAKVEAEQGLKDALTEVL